MIFILYYLGPFFLSVNSDVDRPWWTDGPPRQTGWCPRQTEPDVTLDI